jgi:hypothetical protein
VLRGSDAMLRFGIAAVGLGAMTLLFVFSSASLAAQAGCAGKPGSPDHAALLQYCPQHDRGTGTGSSAGPIAAEIPPSAPTVAAAHHAKNKHSGSHAEVPLTSYPSSGGINLLLLVLLLIALGAGITYGTRRWRRSRPQAS